MAREGHLTTLNQEAKKMYEEKMNVPTPGPTKVEKIYEAVQLLEQGVDLLEALQRRIYELPTEASSTAPSRQPPSLSAMLIELPDSIESLRSRLADATASISEALF